MVIVKKLILFMNFMEIIGTEILNYLIQKTIIKLQIVYLEIYIKKH